MNPLNVIHDGNYALIKLMPNSEHTWRLSGCTDEKRTAALGVASQVRAQRLLFIQAMIPLTIIGEGD